MSALARQFERADRRTAGQGRSRRADAGAVTEEVRALARAAREVGSGKLGWGARDAARLARRERVRPTEPLAQAA